MNDMFQKNFIHAVEKGNLQRATMLISSINVNMKIVQREEVTPLNIAVKMGHINVVKLLLDNGALVYTGDRIGDTSLHYAARSGRKDVLQLLIKYGGSCICEGWQKNTPLHIAVKKKGNVEVMKLLLLNGANINAKNLHHCTPLHIAVQEENNSKNVSLLLKHGADVCSVTSRGLTPLHISFRVKENENIVKLLLQYGAHINAIALSGSTALHLALAEKDNEEIVKILLANGADVNALNGAQLTPLNIAIQNKNIDVVKLLLQYNANLHLNNLVDKILFFVIKYKNVEDILSLLIQYGANINARNSENSTPLHISSEENNKEIVTSLLQNGADITALNNAQLTPLHIAIQKKNIDIIKLFFKYSTNTNFSSIVDQILFFAIRSKSTKEILSLLIENGANVNARNNENATPLHIVTEEGNNKEIATLLLRNGADAGALNKVQFTPLHIAILKKNINMVKVLLQHSRNLSFTNLMDKKLFFAIRCRNEKEIWSLLMQYGANPNARNIENSTPLHIVVDENRSVNDVELLIRYGADVNARNDQFISPLNLAIRNENIDIIKLLLNHGAIINISDLSSYNINNTEIHNVLLKHLIQLKFLDLLIDQDLLDVVNQAENLDVYSNFVKFCKLELERMQKEFVVPNRNVTFYDIMTKNFSKVTRILNATDILQQLHSINYSEKFPAYSAMFNVRIQKCTDKVQLLNKNCESLHNICSKYAKLPSICLNMIQSYLDEKSMRMLNKIMN